MPVPTVTCRAGAPTPRRSAFLPVDAHFRPRGDGTAASSASATPLAPLQAAAEDVEERVR